MEELIKNITDDEFENEVLKSEKPVLVDFWAPWCGPCRMQGEVLKGFAQSVAEKVKIVKVNVDECEKIAMAFGIEVIPTLMVFSNGKMAEKSIGLSSDSELANLLSQYIG